MGLFDDRYGQHDALPEAEAAVKRTKEPDTPQKKAKQDEKQDEEKYEKKDDKMPTTKKDDKMQVDLKDEPQEKDGEQTLQNSSNDLLVDAQREAERRSLVCCVHVRLVCLVCGTKPSGWCP